MMAKDNRLSDQVEGVISVGLKADIVLDLVGSNEQNYPRCRQTNDQ